MFKIIPFFLNGTKEHATLEDIPLESFQHLAFICMPGGSYHRCFRSLLLCPLSCMQPPLSIVSFLCIIVDSKKGILFSLSCVLNTVTIQPVYHEADLPFPMTMSGFLAEVSRSTALLMLLGLEHTGGGGGQFCKYLKHTKPDLPPFSLSTAVQVSTERQRGVRGVVGGGVGG